MESTLSLLSDEEYGENALQSFAEYITTLANSVTPEGYLECAISHIKGTAPELGEGEEDGESTIKALRSTLKLLQRYLQRGTQLTDENVTTLSTATQFVSCKLFEIATYIESNGYDTSQGLSRAHMAELSSWHDGIFDATAGTLNILQKLLSANFSAMDDETLSSAFAFSSMLALANDALSWYLSALEGQHDAKVTNQGKQSFSYKANISDVLRVCGTATSSIVHLCSSVNTAKRQSVCENILNSGLSVNLHKLASLNTSCNGINYCPANTNISFLATMKSCAVEALNVFHDNLLIDAEVKYVFVRLVVIEMCICEYTLNMCVCPSSFFFGRFWYLCTRCMQHSLHLHGECVI
jgi:hypothetical protein